MNKSWSLNWSWIPALLWCGGIFWFSHQPKVNLASAQPSAFITTPSHPILGMIAVDWDTIAGKVAHLIVFGILTILIWQIIPRWQIVLSVIIVYACFDEFHQLYIPGRTGRITDILIDCIGAIVALGWLSWGDYFGETRSTVGNREKGSN